MKVGKVVTAGVLVAVCSACVPEDEGRIVAAKGYGIPKSGEAIPIMGRTFYGSMGCGAMPILKEQPGLAMFDHPWLEIQGPFYQNDIRSLADPNPPKKAWTNLPSKITEVFKQDEWKSRMEALAIFEKRWPGHPFTVAFHGSRPICMLKKTFDTDRGDFAAWKKAHPAFFSFCAFDEYDNDAQGFSWQVVEQVKDPGLLKRYAEMYAPQSEYDYPRKWADLDYEKTKSFHFGSDELYGLWSVTLSVGHNIARKGLKFLYYEAEHGSTASPWRWGGAYARGAARQFRTTFGWYTAMFTNNTLMRNGKSPEGVNGVAIWRDGFTYWPNPNQPNRVKHLGSSRSLLRRNVRYGYYIGNIRSVVECGAHGLFAAGSDGKSWTLSPYGEDYNAVFEWHRRRDRGTVYVPVAFLTSIDENFHRQCYNTFPAKDEASIPAFFFTLVPSYTSDKAVFAEPKLGREGCMWNSEFGEIADVICPDAGQPHAEFTGFLSGYKAAFLIGYHNPKVTDIAAIARYIENGGTVFCSYDQVADGLVSDAAAGVRFGGRTALCGKKLIDETGAEVEEFKEAYTLHVPAAPAAAPFLKDELGNVVAYVNPCGKGRVITVTARRMMPDAFLALKEDGYKTKQWFNGLYASVASGERKFPIVHQLLKRVQKDVMPIAVEGDIQWGLNKTAKGWMLWLINNAGVTKFAFEPEDLDMSKTSKVTVDLKGLKGFGVADISDPVKTFPIEVKDGRFTVSVTPGEDMCIAIE